MHALPQLHVRERPRGPHADRNVRPRARQQVADCEEENAEQHDHHATCRRLEADVRERARQVEHHQGVQRDDEQRRPQHDGVIRRLERAVACPDAIDRLVRDFAGRARPAAKEVEDLAASLVGERLEHRIRGPLLLRSYGLGGVLRAVDGGTWPFSRMYTTMLP